MHNYKFGVGSTREAHSYGSILDLLNSLSDNSQNKIGSRSLRDAFFSVWENSVIRVTSNKSSQEYIGIDRSDVKKKILIGKKEISGKEVMSPDKISSDVDVFFYNTKIDESVDQSLKIAFLSGLDLTNYPFLKVSASGEFTNFDIVNRFGDVSVTSSGDKSVSINGLNFPHLEVLKEMISNPRDLADGDFVFSLSGRHLELRRIGEVSKDADLFYDSRPISATFGSIAVGSTFSGVPLSDVIRKMLYTYTPPSIAIKSELVRERDNNGAFVELDLNINIGSYPIEKCNFVVSSEHTKIGSFSTDLSGGKISFHIGPSQMKQSDSGRFTISMEAFDGVQSSFFNWDLHFVYPLIYGLSENIAEENFFGSNFTKDFIHGDQRFDLIGDGYLYFVYPSSFGEIELRINGMNVSVDSSKGVDLFEPNGRWGPINYRICRTDRIEINPPSNIIEVLFSK